MQTFEILCIEAQVTFSHLLQGRKTLVVAESCTGGMLSAALTSVPGASEVFLGGMVVYANAAKEEWAGVDRGLLERYGAVSAEVAVALAQGVLARSGADLAVSITGIAGPDGGSVEKPEGLVYFAIQHLGEEAVSTKRLFGNQGRERVRLLAARTALRLIDEAMETLS